MKTRVQTHPRSLETTVAPCATCGQVAPCEVAVKTPAYWVCSSCQEHARNGDDD